MISLFAAVVAGFDRSFDLACLLDAWSSRFENCEMVYRIEPIGKSSLLEPFEKDTDVRLTSFEGYAEVLNLTTGTRMAIVTPSYAYTLLLGDTGLGSGANVPQWRRYSGALMGREVDRQRSVATRVLHAFGGVPAGSRDFKSGIRTCRWREYTEKDNQATLRLIDPAGFVKGVSLTYSYDLDRNVPTSFTIESPGGHIRWEMSCSDPSWRPTGNLMRASLSIGPGQGKSEVIAHYLLVSVLPLASRPKLEPPKGAFVLDEATAETIYDGKPTFSADLADQMIAAAKEGREEKLTTFASVAECGPLAVYFLERLIGRAGAYQSSGSEALESMADLVDLSTRHGLETRALHFASDQELPRPPWIAHVAPSHFVVVSAVRGRDLVILDPAAGVSLVAEQTFREAWTGYAICPR